MYDAREILFGNMSAMQRKLLLALLVISKVVSQFSDENKITVHDMAMRLQPVLFKEAPNDLTFYKQALFICKLLDNLDFFLYDVPIVIIVNFRHIKHALSQRI